MATVGDQLLDVRFTVASRMRTGLVSGSDGVSLTLSSSAIRYRTLRSVPLPRSIPYSVRQLVCVHLPPSIAAVSDICALGGFARPIAGPSFRERDCAARQRGGE